MRTPVLSTLEVHAMKAIVRTHAAALMLLAPLGVALTASPAAAQHAVVAPQPAIRTLAATADHGLMPGSTLRLHLVATPGANWAEVALGNSGVRVALREQSPGNYVGSHTVRPFDRIDPFERMTARVGYGGFLATLSFPYPPSFQPPSAGPAPVIERFVMNPRGRLEPGRELRFRLVGAPGADAWMDIPGVVRGLDLQEVRPGVYEGRYTVRRRDDPNAFHRATATLQRGNQRATARVEMRGGDDREDRWGRDDRAPVISDISPDHGARVDERGRTRISARFSDDGTGIDSGSVRLRVDGRDVTAHARIDADEVRYREDLAPGRHTVELVVRDRAGNVGRRVWNFDVGAAYGYQRWPELGDTRP
jgi:hypothetical protein